MFTILDLDVFVPEAQPVSFTDCAGREIRFRLEDAKARLEAERAKLTFEAVAWLSEAIGKRRHLKIKSWFIAKSLEKHIHTFNVSYMAFGTSLYVMQHREELAAITSVKPEDVSEKQYRLLLGIISEICMKTDKSMTVDFLFENLHIIQGGILLQVAMSAVENYIQSKIPGAAAAEK
jgi:hypothetical protein